MNSDPKYINIHTHTPEISSGVVSIYNLKQSEISFENEFSAGLHPWFIKELNFKDQLTELENVIHHEKCIFIGECGLDKLKCSDFSIQQKVFLSQINLAVKYNKPMILHCVKAFDETIVLLKDKIASSKIIFHGFHKSVELAINLIAKGYSISLGKIFLTHPDKAKILLEKVDHSKLFFETDDSDTGIIEIYKIAAQISGLTIEYWKEKLHSNFINIIRK